MSYTITPSLVNVFGFSWNRFDTPFENPTTGGGWAAKVGLTGLPPGQATDVFPSISFGGPGGFSAPEGPNRPTDWAVGSYSQSFVDNAMTYTGQDNLQWLHGKNSVTVGIQVIDQQENVAQPLGGGFVNQFGFSNLETGNILANGAVDPSTGNAYASYLLGVLDNANVLQNAEGTGGGRYKNYAMYVQDDIKWTPKLTVNLGLRYDIPVPWRESHDRGFILQSHLAESERGRLPGRAGIYRLWP